MAVCGRWAGQDGGERAQQETLAPVGGDVGHWRTGGVRPGVEWLAAGPGATELGFPRPALGKMQGGGGVPGG